MAGNLKNIIDLKEETIPELDNARIGIVVALWNEEITDSLYHGCKQALLKLGLKKKNVLRIEVPGAFELPSASKILVESRKVDAVICLGSVIQGETRHFEFICEAVAKGVMYLNLRYNIPFIFGVLTTDTMEQARDRAGGKYGNKGVEAAVAAVKMITVKKKLSK